MSVLMPELPGARVLDLFAGSGALGLECLSRGAAAVVAVEKAGGACRVLRENVRRLGAEGEVELVKADAMGYARGLETGAFDLALADPPYGRGLAAELAKVFLENRFARDLWLEHRRDDLLPHLPDARTRRYGDTLLTRIPAPHA